MTTFPTYSLYEAYRNSAKRPDESQVCCSLISFHTHFYRCRKNASITFDDFANSPYYFTQTVISSSQLLAPAESRCLQEKSSWHTRSLTFTLLAEDEAVSNFMLNFETAVLRAGRRQLSWPCAKKHFYERYFMYSNNMFCQFFSGLSVFQEGSYLFKSSECQLRLWHRLT